MRILDSKDNDAQALLADAPTLLTALSYSSRQRFEESAAWADFLGDSLSVGNPAAVRGLDYYCKP